MKKNTINKLISNLFTFTLLFSTFINTYSFATPAISANDGGTGQILSNVAEILLTVAGIVCVGKLIQIGIKYMMTSVEEKSNAKAALIPWLIGTVVCFGAAVIGPAVINLIAEGLKNKDVLSY